jgi:hypothetical protein
MVWVPVAALRAECLIRKDGPWFGRIGLPHQVPFRTRGHRCQFRAIIPSSAPEAADGRERVPGLLEVPAQVAGSNHPGHIVLSRRLPAWPEHPGEPVSARH